MSAVAIPSQQQHPPHTASLNTPGFFSQAFLELNVFEQCFSSLQSSDSASPSSTPSSSSTSEYKAPASSSSLEPPSPRTVVHQKDKTEYTTPLGPDLSLPSPIMDNQSFMAGDRRFSVHGYSHNLQNENQYMQDRRYSVPAPHSASWTNLDPPGYDDQQVHMRGDPFFLPTHPTPPISVHSNSPMNRYNTPLESTPPRVRQGTELPLSPLDGMIIDGGVQYAMPGQATPPADNDYSVNMVSNPNPELSMAPEVFESPRSPQAKPTRAKRGAAKAATIASTRKPSARKATNAANAEGEEPIDDDKRRKKFLERNRVAASKCRQKKKLWMQKLEENARASQATAKALREQVTILKDEMLNLKGLLLKHTGCGCPQIQTYLENEAAKVAQAAQTSLDTMAVSALESSAQVEGQFTEGGILGENDGMLEDGFNFEDELSYREVSSA